MDFTLKSYQKLLEGLSDRKYHFITCEDYFRYGHSSDERIVILRHDVDKLPENALRTARIEQEMGVSGTYYFRIVPQSFDRKIISEIRKMAHEIGYHYEDLAIAAGDTEKAIRLFERHLKMFQDMGDVKTICMHGSPLSKYDNRQMWVNHSYKSYGIIGEPYYDIDFTKLLYLTDTGRRWDGHKVSVRDKELRSKEPLLSANFRFRSTDEICDALADDHLPDRIMINVHPQRWTDNMLQWSQEWMLQGLKNQVKRLLVTPPPKSPPPVSLKTTLP